MGQWLQICGSDDPVSRAIDENALEGEQVRLNVYDVMDDGRLALANELFRHVGLGAFHAAVDVHGVEWSFGHAEGSATGIFSCRPRGNTSAGRFRECVALGPTALSTADVLQCIRGMEAEWPGDSYDVIGRNCIHFCEALLSELGARPVPSWVFSLVDAGAALQDGADAVMAAARSGAPRLVERMEATLSLAHQYASAVDVVLECTRAPGTDISQLRRCDRCLTLSVAPGRPQKVGPRQQPEHFVRLLPCGEDFTEARGEDSELFELLWEPPCLFLRKPVPEANIFVCGSRVQQATFVLLNSSEIGIAPCDGAPPSLAFKVDRHGSVASLKAERFFGSIRSSSTVVEAPSAQAL